MKIFKNYCLSRHRRACPPSAVASGDCRQAGYSLFELLIVISVFAVLAIVLTQALFLTLRQAKKSEILRSLRETGDHTAAIIERQLHSADSIDECSTGKSVGFKNPDGVSIAFNCAGGTGGTGAGSYIASSSASLVSAVPLTSSSVYLESCSFSCDSISSPSVVYFKATLAPSSGGSERFSVATDVVLRSR